LSRVWVTHKRGFRFEDWIYFILYIHTFRDHRQYSAIAILHTFQFTAGDALGFSVFISRILAADLSQSHCNFKSPVKSSVHRLIPSLPFLLSHLRLPSSELDQFPTTTDCSTRLLCLYCCTHRAILLLLLLSWQTLLITTLYGPHGKHRLLLSRIRVYTSVTYQ
jgi:hypothetical protein